MTSRANMGEKNGERWEAREIPVVPRQAGGGSFQSIKKT